MSRSAKMWIERRFDERENHRRYRPRRIHVVRMLEARHLERARVLRTALRLCCLVMSSCGFTVCGVNVRCPSSETRYQCETAGVFLCVISAFVRHSTHYGLCSPSSLSFATGVCMLAGA